MIGVGTCDYLRLDPTVRAGDISLVFVEVELGVVSMWTLLGPVLIAMRMIKKFNQIYLPCANKPSGGGTNSALSIGAQTMPPPLPTSRHRRVFALLIA